MLHQSGMSCRSLITHDACPEPVWTGALSEATAARVKIQPDLMMASVVFLPFFIGKTCFGLVAVG